MTTAVPEAAEAPVAPAAPAVPVAAPSAPEVPGIPPAAAGPAPVIREETTGFSISSLVLGAVSIVAGFTVFVPITGLILGILALRREPGSRTMAIWGVVLNAVMLAGSLVAVLGAAVVGVAFLPFAFLWGM